MFTFQIIFSSVNHCVLSSGRELNCPMEFISQLFILDVIFHTISVIRISLSMYVCVEFNHSDSYVFVKWSLMMIWSADIFFEVNRIVK